MLLGESQFSVPLCACSLHTKSSYSCFLQHALRLIAFGKAHLVLGVDPLAPPGARREIPPPTGDKVPVPSEKVGETEDGDSLEPEAKRARLADSKE